MIITTVATSLYLFFSVLCQVIASYDKGSKSCDMLSRKQILSLDRKIRIKSPDHLFDLNFFGKRALYNCETFVCSEFFDLSCRSAPKKFSTTCCSVFHRFCHVLPRFTFANLKLAFSLQKLFGTRENSSSSRLPFYPVGKIILLRVLTSLIS